MVLSLLALIVLLGALLFLLANATPVLRDLSAMLRASVTGGRLSEGPFSNVAVAGLWLLIFLIGVL